MTDSKIIGNLNGYPIVLLNRIKRNGYPQAVIEPCPWCDGKHIHGSNDAEHDIHYGHTAMRSSHCTAEDAPESYTLYYGVDTENFSFEVSE